MTATRLRKTVRDFQTMRKKVTTPTTKPKIPPESLPPASNHAIALNKPTTGDKTRAKATDMT